MNNKYLEKLRDEHAEDRRKKLEVGDFVLVRFSTNITIKDYVGEVITHLAVKREGKSYFIWPHLVNLEPKLSFRSVKPCSYFLIDDT